MLTMKVRNETECITLTLPDGTQAVIYLRHHTRSISQVTVDAPLSVRVNRTMKKQPVKNGGAK